MSISRLRLLVTVMVAVMALGAMIAPATVAQKGNSAAAHACNQGGYADLAPAESPSVPFRNTGECVSYHANGGTAVPVTLEVVSACLNGAYANLARPTSPWIAFTSQDECTGFEAGGGHPVPLTYLSVVGSFTDAPGCAATFVGSGFAPNTRYITRMIVNGNWLISVSADTNGAGVFVRPIAELSYQVSAGQSVSIEVRVLDNPDILLATSNSLTCS